LEELICTVLTMYYPEFQTLANQNKPNIAFAVF